MFQRDKDNKAASSKQENADEIASPPLKPFSKKGSHAPHEPSMPLGTATVLRHEIPRRTVDIPSAPGKQSGPDESERRELLVGRDIHLSGDITSCDKLMVEGRVEASLSDARVIEVTPSGFFKGAAEVEEADISGRFEGELIAREKLIVRSGGRVSGSIRYGRIIIESGGEISGEMQTLIQAEKAEAKLKDKEKGPQSSEEERS
jgi:cytoskeletal protein CcmA (bactofilin family)